LILISVFFKKVIIIISIIIPDYPRVVGPDFLQLPDLTPNNGKEQNIASLKSALKLQTLRKAAV